MLKKFFTISVLLLLLLSVLMITGGCGGGSSVNNTPQTPTEPDQPNSEPQDTSQAEVDYALSLIAIGYSNGDNPDYVTSTLILPVKSDETEDVAFTWTSSNPSVISTNGIVNRQANDTEVTLTVRAEKDTAFAEKSYVLNVIRRRSRTPEQAKEEIAVNGVNEIRQMNISNDELQIVYSKNRDRITDIDGKYADFPITTADDAVDAVQSIHGILGIDDPYEELEANVITSDAYGAEYTFSQVHNGIRVFGKAVTVSANSKDEGDFITSKIVPSSKLSDSDLSFTYTQEQAEQTAKTYYVGSYDVRQDMTEKVIFSLYGYADNPVPAYLVNIYGIDDENNELDENIFVNAKDGNVIFASTNIDNADIVDHKTANDEFGKTRTFPVVREGWINGTWDIMRDPDTNVVLYHNYAGINGMFNWNRVSFGDQDEQDVSAYANMIDIMKWWKASFDRNSLDGNGMTVRVITHRPGNKDNAGWDKDKKIIVVYNASDDKRSSAADVVFMAHESTHAVFKYRLGCEFPYRYSYDSTTGTEYASGAIDEGYADIFGCLMNDKWKFALNVHADGDYERDIGNPADPNARQNIKALAQFGHAHAPTTWIERYIGTEDKGGVHINSSLVSYPAYLMHSRYGFSIPELAKLWYTSMRMGYTAESSFKDVRICVLRAARKLGMSREKISGIEQAFDDVGITAEKGSLKGTVSRYNGGALSYVIVTAYGTLQNDRAYSAVTDANGNYSLNLSSGTYTVEVSVNGYVPFSAFVQVEEGTETELDIPLVSPGGTSTLNGIVRDSQTGQTLEGVHLKVLNGWNVHTGDTTAATITQTDGTYSTPLIAGYYTAEFSKEGYITTSVNNLVISSDETLARDVILSRTIDDKYRVTLQWAENPSDLDSHLIGNLPEDIGGESFHVYYRDKTAGYYDGDYVAFLDHDDTSGNGFETITFQMQPGDTFRYYVHWFAGGGTWAGSNAVVNLYKSTDLIATFSVPNVNTSVGYWHVFDLTDGLDPVRPSDNVPIYYTAPSLP